MQYNMLIPVKCCSCQCTMHYCHYGLRFPGKISRCMH